MKVVYDTNILISALFWRGAPYRCLLSAQAGLVELVLSGPILSELNRVLKTKFLLADEAAAANEAAVRAIATLVTIEGALRVISADPDDDKFIETALVGHADCLVSGDQHLLSLGSYRHIRILTARAFLDLLQ